MWPLVLLLLCGCAGARRSPSQNTVFYPMPPDRPRIQYLTTITDEVDVGAKRRSVMEFVTGKKETMKRLGRPWDVAHDKGKLYVVDRQYSLVIIIDLIGREFDRIGYAKGGRLVNPAGIFLSPEGLKYVADKERRQIMVFDATDEFHRSYVLDEDSQPLDVAVGGGRMYVCDIAREEVLVLDLESGEIIDRIGGRGQAEGKFRWPTHLTLDGDGNLYVTDMLNSRVQRFDSQGNFVRAIGQPGDFPGAMPRPKGVAVDREEHLYVVDVAFELVQIFDASNGEVLMPFGKLGASAAGIHLPAGIHIDYDNLEYFSQYVDENFRPKYLIYVCNQTGPWKLNVYAFGDWVAPGT